MKEILFRGKRVDNGEWVEGDLLRSRGKCYIHMHTDPFDYLGELSGFIKMYEVEPHTVRQYTGLKDKNGKKIFEGDIIEYEKDGATYEIIFVKENGITKFCSKFIPDGSLGYINEDRDKVIGNIYDNPELLEVKDELEI